MNRSHRLLRAVHRKRLDRVPFAEVSASYEAFTELRPFERLIRDLHGDGVVDRTEAYGPTMALADALSAQLAADLGPDGPYRQLASLISTKAFSRRRKDDGRHSLGGSDRYMADGCASLAQAALLDRFFRAVGEVMRLKALVDHRDNPCWPEAYVQRRAAAEDARLGLSEGIAGDAPGGLPSVSGEAEAEDEIDLQALADLADDDDDGDGNRGDDDEAQGAGVAAEEVNALGGADTRSG